MENKPSPSTYKNVHLLSKRVVALEKQMRAMRESLTEHSYKLTSHTKHLKKTEKMHAIIRQCHIKITGYNSINNKSVNFYNKVILRMREIQKDYTSLFKKVGTTITFFEKRELGEDWIPGEPVEETERTKVDQTEAAISAQLKEMEESLDD